MCMQKARVPSTAERTQRIWYKVLHTSPFTGKLRGPFQPYGRNHSRFAHGEVIPPTLWCSGIDQYLSVICDFGNQSLISDFENPDVLHREPGYHVWRHAIHAVHECGKAEQVWAVEVEDVVLAGEQFLSDHGCKVGEAATVSGYKLLYQIPVE